MSSSLSVQTRGGGGGGGEVLLLRSGQAQTSHKHSSCSIAAQEGVEHGQLHALLIPSTPRHHRALAVGRVEVVAITRVRQAEADTRGDC